MDKQSYDKRPDSAFLEIVKSENEILFGKRRRFLPRPDAGSDASEYQERVGSQESVRLPVAVTPNTLAGTQLKILGLPLNACRNDSCQNFTQQAAENLW